uniref:Uncharacterized protein n=1 Tax=Rhodnius prolixus TaxID=13249 RepID=T1HUQ2_RHOPR
MDCFKPPSPLVLTGNVAENWRSFKAELEIFIKAADITEDKKTVGRKVAVLLNLIGAEVGLYRCRQLWVVTPYKYGTDICRKRLLSSSMRVPCKSSVKINPR